MSYKKSSNGGGREPPGKSNDNSDGKNRSILSTPAIAKGWIITVSLSILLLLYFPEEISEITPTPFSSEYKNIINILLSAGLFKLASELKTIYFTIRQPIDIAFIFSVSIEDLCKFNEIEITKSEKYIAKLYTFYIGKYVDEILKWIPILGITWVLVVGIYISSTTFLDSLLSILGSWSMSWVLVGLVFLFLLATYLRLLQLSLFCIYGFYTTSRISRRPLLALPSPIQENKKTYRRTKNTAGQSLEDVLYNEAGYTTESFTLISFTSVIGKKINAQ